MSDAPSDLGAAADELYGLPPADFTARRDELSKAARSAGDRDLAGQVKALRRPTASAWLLNLAARAQTPELAALVDLGERMRQAQADLDGAALKDLSQQRSGVEKAVLRTVQQLGREQGQDLTTAAASEVEQTLRAALADPRAARAVLSGRLTRALAYAGFGEVDLDAATATPVDDDAPAVRDELAARRAEKAAAAKEKTPKEKAPKEKAPKEKAPKEKAPKEKAARQDAAAREEASAREEAARRDEAERRAERERQERARQEQAQRRAALQAAVEEARRAAAEADRQAEQAQDAQRTAEELVADLHRRLREARDAVTAASKQAAAAERERSRAARALAQAERELLKAEPDDD